MKSLPIPVALSLLCSLAVQASAEPPVTKAAPGKLNQRKIPGFALKKSAFASGRVTELWERATDKAQLRIEVVPKAGSATVDARLKSVNAKLPKDGRGSEELLYLFETSDAAKGWTNYRGTTNFPFKTYRYWKLQDGTLVLADFTFTGSKPSLDRAREAFVTSKKAADGTLKALQGS